MSLAQKILVKTGSWGSFSSMSAVNERRGRYSREYTTGHIASTRNKHINRKCVYMKVFILGAIFCFKQFYNYETFSVPQHL
jgi:hypothetical protein